MVLESFLSPVQAEEHPWKMLIIGFVYASIGSFLALWIFKEQASFVMIFFTVIACVPVVYNTLKYEEAKDTKTDDLRVLQAEHLRAVWVLSYLVLGIIIAGAMWYVLLPAEMVSNLFSQQIDTIAQINNKVSASVTGLATSQQFFFRIFANNMKVLMFTILFSFIFGAGAIFILTWNASVIAAAIGNFIRTNLIEVSAQVGASKLTGYVTVVSTGFLKYAPHGVWEMIAYFYGGIAGGIISVAVIKNHFQSKHGSVLIMDISELLLIAVGFVLIGAVIEAFITPILSKVRSLCKMRIGDNILKA